MENEIRNPESGGISVERTFTIIDSKIGSKRNEEETKGEQTYFVFEVSVHREFDRMSSEPITS